MFLWLLLAVMHPSVTVEGEVTCPAPAEVARHLADLMAGVREGVAPDRARLRQQGGALTIDLVRDDGSRIAERTLPAGGSCADLASAMAVIIATWEAQLRPQRLGRVALGAPPVVTASAAPRTPPEPFDLGLGFQTFVADRQIIPGAVLFGSFGDRLGLVGAVSVSAARVDAVSDTAGGTTSWTRDVLALGPRYRFARGHLRADGFVTALGALLSVSGSGLTRNLSDASFDVGAGAGARVALAFERVAPWIGIGVEAWPASHHLTVQGAAGQLDIPRAGLQLALGVSVGRF